MRSGAIDAIEESIHFTLTNQAILHHVVGSNEETIGRDQKSRAQVGSFPIPLAILVFQSYF